MAILSPLPLSYSDTAAHFTGQSHKLDPKLSVELQDDSVMARMERERATRAHRQGKATEGDKGQPYEWSGNTRLSKVPLKRGEDNEKVFFSGLGISNFIHI